MWESESKNLASHVSMGVYKVIYDLFLSRLKIVYQGYEWVWRHIICEDNEDQRGSDQWEHTQGMHRSKKKMKKK